MSSFCLLNLVTELTVFTFTEFTEKVAVKIIDKTRLQTKNIQMLSKEVSAMESIQHPHIIRLYEVIHTPSKMFLAMEYAEGGELFHKIANGGRMPEDEAKPIFAQLTSAVAHMVSETLSLNLILIYYRGKILFTKE